MKFLKSSLSKKVITIVTIFTTLLSMMMFNIPNAKAGNISYPSDALTIADNSVGATTAYTFKFTPESNITASQETPTMISLNTSTAWIQVNGNNTEAKINLVNATLDTQNSTAGLQIPDFPNVQGETYLTLITTSTISGGTEVIVKLNDVLNPSVIGGYRYNIYTSQSAGQGQEPVPVDGSQNAISSHVALIGNVQVYGTLTDPNGAAFYMGSVEVANNDRSTTVNVSPATDGKYYIGGLSAGNYNINAYADSSYGYFSTAIPITITSAYGSSNLLNKNIQFSAATKTVTGTVTDNTGAVVASANINAFDSSSGQFNQATTNSSGQYTLKLVGGSWEVRPNPTSSDSWAYSGFGKTVSFAKNSTAETQSGINFTVQKTNATVTGKMLMPDGSVPPEYSIHGELSKNGPGVGFELDSSGNFSVNVVAGFYELQIWSQNKTIAVPASAKNVMVSVGETKNLGTITLEQRTSKISGVVKDSNGNPLSGIFINAMSMGFDEWTGDNSAADGSFNLYVKGGGSTTYLVQAMSNPSSQTSYAYLGNPVEVTLAVGGTATANFTMTQLDATIRGNIYLDGTSTVVSDIDSAFVDANLADTENYGPPPMGGQVQNGSFSFPVLGGKSYTLGLYMGKGAAYSVSSTQTASVSAGETKTVNLYVKPNNSTISGTLKDSSGNAVTGIDGEVFAASKVNHVYNGGIINTSTGTYTISVSAGKWSLGAKIDSATGYSVDPKTFEEVEIAANQTVSKDITLLKVDSTINVTVKDQDGNTLPNAWVKADSRNAIERKDVPDFIFDNGAVTNSSGQATIAVPAGAYQVSANMPPSEGYIGSSSVSTTVSSSSPASINLTMKKSNANITGTVSLDGSGTSAYINGWSESGGNNTTTAGSDGSYTLPVVKGEKWHIKAMKEGSGETFYTSSEHIVDTAQNDSTTQNFTLSQSTWGIPPAISVSFASNRVQVIRLKNGMTVTIPANALASDGSTVTVTITPTVQIPKINGEGSISDFAYNITAISSTGQSISSFNSNVTISIPYTDEMLAAVGITESELVGKFLNEYMTWADDNTTFTVDKENNILTISTSHFTSFAITAIADSTPPSAPTSVLATAASEKVTLLWTNPTESDFAGVKVYRSTTSGQTGELITTINSTSTTSYENTGLTNGTKYHYTLKAYDTVGNLSSATSEISATPNSLPTTGKDNQSYWYIVLTIIISVGVIYSGFVLARKYRYLLLR